MSERLGDKIPISENGMHYGVLYNDKVYCNIYPEGQPYDEWKENFYDFWDSEPVVEFVPIE